MEMTKRQYEELLKRLSGGEDISDMVKNYDAHTIRDFGEQAAGKFAKDQYGANTVEDLKKLYEKPEVLANTSIHENPKLLNELDAHGIYYPKQNKIILNNAEDLATGIHELSHPYDEKAHGFFNVRDALTGNKKSVGMDLAAKGLEAAEELNRGHFFKDDLKGFAQLQRMLKGQPLRNIAIPALALGSALYSAGSKASEGDLTGAALSGAGIVDPTGIASGLETIRDRLKLAQTNPAEANKQSQTERANYMADRLGDYTDTGDSIATVQELKSVTDPVAEEYRSLQKLKSRLGR